MTGCPEQTGHRQAAAYLHYRGCGPHGKTLAIGSFDGSVWLLDVATRQPERPVTTSDFTVYSVAFSPDGKTLASGTIGFTVRLWNVATPSHSLADTSNCAVPLRPRRTAPHPRRAGTIRAAPALPASVPLNT